MEPNVIWRFVKGHHHNLHQKMFAPGPFFSCRYCKEFIATREIILFTNFEEVKPKRVVQGVVNYFLPHVPKVLGGGHVFKGGRGGGVIRT